MTAKRIFMPPDKRNVGMVYQSYAIWPHMTVAENVAFPLHARHFAKNEIRERVLKALDLVGLAARRILRTARVRLVRQPAPWELS
jgi:iron(III) transport system ATP-binding protein